MKVTSIVIVGGGTSAWMTAAYLYNNNPDIKITVVDKEVGNPIGVGEATLLSFKPFMEECGFDINEWFVPLDAGFKSGILFANWTGPGNNIWHPFYKGNRNVKDLKIWDVWSNHQHLDFKKYALSSYGSSVENNKVDNNAIQNYAFHVDCGKLVLFIQEKLKNKIRIIKSDVINVINDDYENIDFLQLKNGDSIKGDLYIDCTGFKNILRKPKERIDLSDRLFVNTAVVCPIPYQDRDNEFKPYAVCEAVDHGWIWKIGVSSRIGSGLVFNREITDIEEAKEYFVNHWDNRIKKENVRVIDWTPFYNKDQWAGNVVSIGLSAGFIEPLESTGIGLITYGITQLSNALHEKNYNLLDIEYFNLNLNILFEDCIDFVSMHYANNTRTSKFWKLTSKKFTPSARMKNFLEDLNDPTISVPQSGKYNYMFGGANWSLCLIQLGFTVASRILKLPSDLSLELLIANYVEHEKNKHIWSRHHSSDVDRIRELKNL